MKRDQCSGSGRNVNEVTAGRGELGERRNFEGGIAGTGGELDMQSTGAAL